MTAAWQTMDIIEQRAYIEQRIAEVGLRPYQAMVVRRIADAENVTAAVNWIEQIAEVTNADDAE